MGQAHVLEQTGLVSVTGGPSVSACPRRDRVDGLTRVDFARVLVFGEPQTPQKTYSHSIFDAVSGFFETRSPLESAAFLEPHSVQTGFSSRWTALGSALDRARRHTSGERTSLPVTAFGLSRANRTRMGPARPNFPRPEARVEGSRRRDRAVEPPGCDGSEIKCAHASAPARRTSADPRITRARPSPPPRPDPQAHISARWSRSPQVRRAR